MNRIGKCLCGAVSFTAADPDPKLGACHCTMCQHWSGSALITATVKPGMMQVKGAEHLTHFNSSDWAERVFCSKCGSGLYYEVTAPGAHHATRYVPVGLFDDTDGMHLEHEIFHDKRLGVFSYAGETKKLTEAEVMAQFVEG